MLVSLLLMTATGSALAQPSTPPAGAGALGRARSAWQKGDFDVAEAQYKAAIDAGGLAPDEVVDAYVHLGVARTVQAKRGAALEAFRLAALLDLKFVVPPEAGKGATYLAEAARKEKAKFGSIALRAEVPSVVKSGQPFNVDASLDTAHVSLVAKMTVSVRDALSAKRHDGEMATAPEVRFEIPTAMTLPGASLMVRIDALDAHKNRLASVEHRVRVEGATASVVNASANASGNATRRGANGSDEKRGESGGFWSTAWPWFIGGVALAAGGTAVYFGTRPSDAVSVGGVHVQTVR